MCSFFCSFIYLCIVLCNGIGAFHIETEVVKEILRRFKAAGIDNAEFCLVGWNKGGHDGAFPDLFPVEKTLGSEDELR